MLKLLRYGLIGAAGVITLTVLLIMIPSDLSRYLRNQAGVLLYERAQYSLAFALFAGLPPEVPLDILAHENGDSTYYRNITEPDDETVLLEDLAAFSGIPVDIQTFERVSAIAAR